MAWARLQLAYRCRDQADALVGSPRRWLRCERGVHVLLLMMLQPLLFIVVAVAAEYEYLSLFLF